MSWERQFFQVNAIVLPKDHNQVAHQLHRLPSTAPCIVPWVPSEPHIKTRRLSHIVVCSYPLREGCRCKGIGLQQDIGYLCTNPGQTKAAIPSPFYVRVKERVENTFASPSPSCCLPSGNAGVEAHHFAPCTVQEGFRKPMLVQPPTCLTLLASLLRQRSWRRTLMMVLFPSTGIYHLRMEDTNYYLYTLDPIMATQKSPYMPHPLLTEVSNS